MIDVDEEFNERRKKQDKTGKIKIDMPKLQREEQRISSLKKKIRNSKKICSRQDYRVLMNQDEKTSNDFVIIKRREVIGRQEFPKRREQVKIQKKRKP